MTNHMVTREQLEVRIIVTTNGAKCRALWGQ